MTESVPAGADPFRTAVELPSGCMGCDLAVDCVAAVARARIAFGRSTVTNLELAIHMAGGAPDHEGGETALAAAKRLGAAAYAGTDAYIAKDEARITAAFGECVGYDGDCGAPLGRIVDMQPIPTRYPALRRRSV